MLCLCVIGRVPRCSGNSHPDHTHGEVCHAELRLMLVPCAQVGTSPARRARHARLLLPP
ncbi:hypothetical protein ACTMU2_30475 [Cupriavidus basilensis]